MSYRNSEPTGLDLLKLEYGKIWDITADDTGLIQAVQKVVPADGTQQTRWEWTVEDLRRRLEAYDAEQARSRALGAP